MACSQGFLFAIFSFKACCFRIMTNICRHQILKMNGFSPADFDSKKQAKLVEHLLKESESFYGHD